MFGEPLPFAARPQRKSFAKDPPVDLDPAARGHRVPIILPIGDGDRGAVREVVEVGWRELAGPDSVIAEAPS
jgi:hypothetical protein